MKEFDALLEINEILHGPDGCPWDQKQDFFSLQPYVLEEAHEVIDAIDHGDDEKIKGELGDLLYTIIFYAKVAEKEGRFKLQDVLEAIREKLIRRHPHVFDKSRNMGIDEVIEKWEELKKEEKEHSERKSILDGIPKNLPVLARSQKILGRIKRSQAELLKPHTKREHPLTEKIIGEEMIQAILDAEEAGIDVESALRRALSRYEDKYRSWEESK